MPISGHASQNRNDYGSERLELAILVSCPIRFKDLSLSLYIYIYIYILFTSVTLAMEAGLGFVVILCASNSLQHLAFVSEKNIFPR